MIARLFKWTLTSRIKDPAASNGVSNLQRCRAAGYLTLAAVAKCLQAVTWLVARANQKTHGHQLMSFKEQRYKDSNLEMTESESVALPFGDSPLFIVQMVLYINTIALARTFFHFFQNYCTKINTYS